MGDCATQVRRFPAARAARTDFHGKEERGTTHRAARVPRAGLAHSDGGDQESARGVLRGRRVKLRPGSARATREAAVPL